MNLTAGYREIFVEYPYDGLTPKTVNNTTFGSVVLKFKKTSDAVYRTGMPLWCTDDGTAKLAFGMAVNLDPDQEYNIRVEFLRSDDVVVTTDDIKRTRVDPGNPVAVTPTHYVRSDGNNNNTGTSDDAGGAWLTAEKAITAINASTVPIHVQFQGVPFQRPTTTLSNPNGVVCTLQAANVACDDNQEAINEGSRTIFYERYVAPSASGDANAVTWTQETFGAYSVWTYDPGLSAVIQCGFSATKFGDTERLPHWKAVGSGTPNLTTAAGFAEIVNTNLSQPYGFAQYGTKLHVRMPGGVDPNNYYFWFGKNHLLTITGSNVRVRGIEFRCGSSGIHLQNPSTQAMIDHCFFQGNFRGITFRAAEVIPTVYPTEPLLQYLRFQDRGLWNTSQDKISWKFIKGKFILADGSEYISSQVGSNSQTNGIWQDGGALRPTIRYCTFDGVFNGYGGQLGSSHDRYGSYGSVVIEPVFIDIADDCLEPEQQAINWWMYKVDATNCPVVLSTAPIDYGPVWLHEPRGFNISTGGIRPDGNPAGSVVGAGAFAFKFAGGGSPLGLVIITNGTLWSNSLAQTGTTVTSLGAEGSQSAGGSGAECFWIRNTYMRFVRYVMELPKNDAIQKTNEDYNAFFTEAAGFPSGRVLNYGSQNKTTIALYRADIGDDAFTHPDAKGVHTNNFGGSDRELTDVTWADAQLVNAAAGDLHLAPGSPLLAAGAIIPNFERPGIDFAGALPDIGYSQIPPPPDTTPPTFASAQVPAAGTTVVVTLVEAGSSPVLPASGVTGFAVTVNGVARSITSATASGVAVTLTLASVVNSGDSVTVAYTPGNVTDSAGTPNAMAAFGAQSVANNSVQSIVGTGTRTYASRTYAPRLYRSMLADVPTEEHILYGALLSYLNAFTPGPAQSEPIFACEDFWANSHNGEAMLVEGVLDADKAMLNILAAAGLTGITITAHEDIWHHARAAEFQAYYTAIANHARSLGLTILCETAASFLDPARYAGMTFAQYKTARLEGAQACLTYIQPTYLLTGDEIDSEVTNTGFAELDTPAEYATFTSELHAGLTGVGSTLLGVGTGGWTSPLWAYGLCALSSVQVYGVHVYPVYGGFLDNTVSHVRVARGFDKRVVMGEAWLFKRQASEAGVGVANDYYRKDVWRHNEPLDELFFTKIAGMARAEQIEFISMYWTRYFFARYAWSEANKNLTQDQVMAIIGPAATAAINAGTLSTTGQFYGRLASQ